MNAILRNKGHVLWVSSVCAIAACGSDPPLAQVESQVRAGPASGPDTESVTLLTGDRVLYGHGPGGPTVHVEPGPGRSHVGFATLRDHDHLLVIPQDVAHHVAAHRVDRALFDVTGLVNAGYADRERDDLPLILTGPSALTTASHFAPDGVVVDRRMPALHAVAVRQRKASPGAALAGLGEDGTRIWLDRIRKPAMLRGGPVLGPLAHRAVAPLDGPTGAGVTVAVLDTGIDATHPDLAGKVIAAQDFTDDGLGVGDVFGEGTHVASVIAGSGAASDGEHRGVAPDAQLVSARVCQVAAPFGFVFCTDSAVLAGLEWAVAEQHAQIVDILPVIDDQPGTDEIEDTVQQLAAQFGTLFVSGAGDFGEFGDSILAEPGNLDVALSVNAVDGAGQLASFASRGPRIDDGAIKPDLTALGVDVVGARASGVDPIGAPVGTAYQTLSGTAIAAPRAAGAAALVFQQHPAWTAAQVKAALTGAADPSVALTAFEQGSGQLDIARVTTQPVTAEPSNLSLGLARWPHTDDPLIERTVTYHNAGATAAHLALAVALRDPARQPAPGRMARVTPVTLDVPAGGSAEAVVTIDTNGDAPDAQYEGALTATSGEVRIVTPVAVAREAESYDLTIRVSDGDGQPASAFAVLIGRGRGTIDVLDITGELTVRRLRDQYSVLALLDSTFLTFPRLELDHDALADLDGRQALPIALKVPGLDPEIQSEELLYVDVPLRIGLKLQNIDQLLSANFGPELEGARSVAAVSNLQPFDTSEPDTVYLLAHGERGHMMTGWSEVIEPRKFARVDVHALAHGVSSWRKWASVVFDDAPELGSLIGDLGFADYPGAFDRTEYYYGPGFRFEPLMFEQAATFIDLPLNVEQQMRAQRYRPGSHTRETWHQAPFGPAFAPLGGNPAARRVGDVLTVTPSMISDQGVPARSTFTLQDHDRNALFRDGALLVEHLDFHEDFFPPVTVPPGPATYRFERSMSRGEPTRFTGETLFELSPEVSAAWTFRSAHVDGTALLALPTLRFSPVLDDDNRTAARLLVLPVRVERPEGAPTPAIRDLDLEVSFDDGAHWAALPVARFGDQAVAIVLHPRHASFVSLRGSATDVAGNHVDQTILHAYGLAPGGR